MKIYSVILIWNIAISFLVQSTWSSYFDSMSQRNLMLLFALVFAGMCLIDYTISGKDDDDMPTYITGNAIGSVLAYVMVVVIYGG